MALQPTPQAGSQAAPSLQQRPQMLERLAACRTVADSTARLACYDGAAAALDTAQQQGELVIIDRAAVNETRRELFGFNMPALPQLFGNGGGGDAADLDAIETTLQRASRNSEGRWVFTLANGAVWRQIDSETLRFDNRPGEAVRVRKASLGSFMMTIGDSRAVRVRRQ
ncbi:MAG: hypothetical protein REJ23_06930 [Brevundimonas sp.]|nr:hypothetical protein [Brevundimonas sp.]